MKWYRSVVYAANLRHLNKTQTEVFYALFLDCIFQNKKVFIQEDKKNVNFQIHLSNYVILTIFFTKDSTYARALMIHSENSAQLAMETTSVDTQNKSRTVKTV